MLTKDELKDYGLGRGHVLRFEKMVLERTGKSIMERKLTDKEKAKAKKKRKSKKSKKRPPPLRQPSAVHLQKPGQMIRLQSIDRMIQERATLCFANLKKEEMQSNAAKCEFRPRKALVIGNGDYKNYIQLNTQDDIDNVSDKLGEMCYSVTHKGFKWIRPDLRTKEAMFLQIKKFCKMVLKGDDILFYFAGHGVKFAGTTYLIPCDAPFPLTTNNIQDTCVSMDDVMIMMSATGPADPARLKMFIIDACAVKLEDQPDVEDEPGYSPVPVAARGMKSRSGAEQNKSITDAAKLFMSPLGRNIYTLYATSPGCKAFEDIGGGRFSNAFTHVISKPNVNLGNLAAMISEKMNDSGEAAQLPTTGQVTVIPKVLPWRFCDTPNRAVPRKVYKAPLPIKMATLPEVDESQTRQPSKL